MRDKRFIAEHRGGPLKKERHYQLITMKLTILIVTLSIFELCSPASAADITQIHSRDGATKTPGSSSIEERKSHANIAGVPDLRTNAGKLRSTVITPHVECTIVPGTNILWCSAFQYAWNELKRKFKGKADFHLNISAAPAEWVAYAYLFKELPFQWAFTRSHESLAFEGYYVDIR